MKKAGQQAVPVRSRHVCRTRGEPYRRAASTDDFSKSVTRMSRLLSTSKVLYVQRSEKSYSGRFASDGALSGSGQWFSAPNTKALAQ